MNKYRTLTRAYERETEGKFQYRDRIPKRAADCDAITPKQTFEGSNRNLRSDSCYQHGEAPHAQTHRDCFGSRAGGWSSIGSKLGFHTMTS